MFYIIQYFIAIFILIFCLSKMLKKYLTPITSRGDDYYLILAIIGIISNYTSQFIMVFSGVYSAGIIFFAHFMMVFGFWGFSSFMINQVFFKSITQYRIHKLLLATLFAMSAAISALLVVQNSIEPLPGVSVEVLSTILPNKTADILMDSVCLLASWFMVTNNRKIKLRLTYFLRGGIYLSFICYLLFLVNTIFFNGSSYIIFYIANSSGVIASALTSIVLIDYYKKAKAVKVIS